MERIFYMPAVNQQEAQSLVIAGYGHTDKQSAEQHLADIKKEAGPFYGNQYSVFRCVVNPRVDSMKFSTKRMK